MVITPGSQSAITTAFNALAAPGAAVLIESPSYTGCKTAVSEVIAAQAALVADVNDIAKEHLV